jgi:hypothetical protein
VRTESNAAPVEFVIQTLHVALHRRVPQFQPQIAHAQLQQFFVGQIGPIHPSRPAGRPAAREQCGGDLRHA